jgi:hypothetical protein
MWITPALGRSDGGGGGLPGDPVTPPRPIPAPDETSPDDPKPRPR